MPARGQTTPRLGPRAAPRRVLIHGKVEFPIVFQRALEAAFPGGRDLVSLSGNVSVDQSKVVAVLLMRGHDGRSDFDSPLDLSQELVAIDDIWSTAFCCSLGPATAILIQAENR